MENTGDTGSTVDNSVDNSVDKDFMEKASADISASLFGNEPEVEIEEEVDPETTDVKTDIKTEVKTEVTPEVVLRPPPKSWAKEKHELWGKVPPEAQEYFELREKQMLDGLEQYKGDSGLGRQIKDILNPYQPILQSQGLDAPTAIQALLNAHYQLTNGTPENRKSAYQKLGESLGLIDQTGTEVNPQFQSLQDQIQNLQRTIHEGQQNSYKENHAKVMKEVEAFASDAAHPYFNDVADDIVAMIQAGASLQDAYEKAVWANPMTRQKEMSRIQTENETKLKEKAKLEAEAAKKASSTNVKSRDTRRTPTEPKGSMEDTMKDTLRSIRERTH